VFLFISKNKEGNDAVFEPQQHAHHELASLAREHFTTALPMDVLDLPINWTFFSTKNVKSERVEQFASSQATQI
jgi:hypothetical protein